MLGEDFPAQLAWFRQGSVLAGYRLEAQVGSGGMAVVFRARDERLGRPVALKILAPALASDGTFRRRFIAESRAAARVDDPHIIPVYEAGEANGVLFIAMRLVIGGDLRRVLEQEGALPPDRAAEFISPVASALDAAHGAGLVHRDVKPANILVDARPGRPDHVYLSDFGVSKGAVSSVSLTGQFLGTPVYSAPEQIQCRVVDGRTDQYALACVAYQLLTGSVPFERDQGLAVLLAHLSEPPPSLGSRRPGLPDAADQVLARALAKAPENRYGSCGDFADALNEALGLAPYRTRRSASTPNHSQIAITTPPDFPEPISDGAGKAAMSAGIAAAATIDSVPAGVSPGAADLPAAAANGTGRADQGTRPGALRLMPPWVAEADSAAAAATAPVASAPDARRAHQRPSSLPGSHRRVRPTQRRGRLLAITLAAAVLAVAAIVIPLLASSHSSHASTISQSFGRLSAFTDPGSMGVTSVAFSRSGTTLATADSNGSTYLWNIPGGTLAATLTDPNSQAGVGVTSVAFSPSGAILATADGNDRTYLWNIPSGKRRATLADLTNPNSADLTNPMFGYGSANVTSVAFSRSGTTLATADSNGSTYLWNIPSGKLAATLTDPNTTGVASVAFSPNGATLATADSNGSTYLWNTATRQRTATLTQHGSGAQIASIAFNPSGTTLATADSYGTTYLWNIPSGKLAAILTDPNSTGVTSVAFSPSGTTLATADGNGSTYLWNIPSGKLAATLTAPRTTGVGAVAFSPSGATLATADDNGITYLWGSASSQRSKSRTFGGKLAATFTDPGTALGTAVAFSPNGDTLATADSNGSTYLWNTATRQRTATLTDPSSGGVTAVAFSPNGDTLATADSNGSTYLWNTATRQRTATLTDPYGRIYLGAAITSVAFSPSGATLATADNFGSTRLWNIATRKLTATFTDPSGSSVASVAFSPSGATLATADNFGSTRLWNVATRKLTATFASPGVTSVAFSPNGATLATGGSSSYLWNIATGKLTAAFTDPSHGARVVSVAFSPNGAALAATDNYGHTYLWNIS